SLILTDRSGHRVAPDLFLDFILTGFDSCNFFRLRFLSEVLNRRLLEASPDSEMMLAALIAIVERSRSAQQSEFARSILMLRGFASWMV
ncbi:MAG TPA: hypothetical protein VI455_17815, partial [Terriglobia bacterium]